MRKQAYVCGGGLLEKGLSVCSAYLWSGRILRHRRRLPHTWPAPAWSVPWPKRGLVLGLAHSQPLLQSIASAYSSTGLCCCTAQPGMGSQPVTWGGAAITHVIQCFYWNCTQCTHCLRVYSQPRQSWKDSDSSDDYRQDTHYSLWVYFQRGFHLALGVQSVSLFL